MFSGVSNLLVVISSQILILSVSISGLRFNQLEMSDVQWLIEWELPKKY